MTADLCKLCLSDTAIKNSHVIPKFVFHAIKSDSPTGFLRNPIKNPNLRVQDDDKYELLCLRCEKRISSSENEFAKHAFMPYHNSDQIEFSYRSWLHYFLTSLAWRTLVLDLPGLKSDVDNPRSAIEALEKSSENMRRYLLGAVHLADSIRNHVLVVGNIHSASARLTLAGPNTMVRRSAVGYALIDQTKGYSAIAHNLAGFLCFLIIRGNPRDQWSGTKINPTGGQLKQPQQCDSWFAYHIINHLCDAINKLDSMSDTQKRKVKEQAFRNPSSPAFRFTDLDRRVNAVE